MKIPNRLVLVASTALCCGLAMPARAQKHDLADQKVAADKAKLVQDLDAIKAVDQALENDRRNLKVDEEQLRRDKASGKAAAVQNDMAQLKSAREQLRKDRAVRRKDDETRKQDERQLREDRRLDRREDRRG